MFIVTGIYVYIRSLLTDKVDAQVWQHCIANLFFRGWKDMVWEESPAYNNALMMQEKGPSKSHPIILFAWMS